MYYNDDTMTLPVFYSTVKHSANCSTWQ